MKNPVRAIHCSICRKGISGYDFPERTQKLRRHYKRAHPTEFMKWFENPTLKIPVKSKEQLGHLFKAQEHLGKAGVTFDTGTKLTKPMERHWELDWSLKEARIKNPNKDISDYKLILAVMPPNIPLTAAQISKRVGLPTKEMRPMLGELCRYGLIKATIDGYVKKNPIHPQALESLKRYNADVRAGHKDAAEYWRGQAGAYFTGNPKPEKYQLFISGQGIFGPFEHKAVLQKKIKGWDYWIEQSDGSMKKITRGRKYLVGETLNEVIANIERGGEYADRKVVKVEKVNPILETLGSGILTGIGVGTGWIAANRLHKKLMKKNPVFFTPDQILTIHQITKGDMNFRGGREGTTGAIWLVYKGVRYIISKNGKILKNSPLN